MPPRAVLLTCDDDLRNTLTEMVPMLQEHGLSCLFFVTGASLSDVPAMLWYEQLYLMLLAVREEYSLDLAAAAFRRPVGDPAGETAPVVEPGQASLAIRRRCTPGAA